VVCRYHAGSIEVLADTDSDDTFLVDSSDDIIIQVFNSTMDRRAVPENAVRASHRSSPVIKEDASTTTMTVDDKHTLPDKYHTSKKARQNKMNQRHHNWNTNAILKRMGRSKAPRQQERTTQH
jgi:transglutaminase/protease-like cytokinesis protein 3